MKNHFFTPKIFSFFAFLLIVNLLQVSAQTENRSSAKDTNTQYDSILAKSLGADDYGMKMYVLVILKTGENKSTDKSLIQASFRGHMNNISAMEKDGKLVLAGPIQKNPQSYRGIFILNVPSFEEAEKLLAKDGAIKEGFLTYELLNYYGSAALPEYLKTANKIWKKSP